jgi:hypothetical protein
MGESQPGHVPLHGIRLGLMPPPDQIWVGAFMLLPQVISDTKLESVGSPK